MTCLIVTIFTLLITSTTAFAGWTGPETVVSGGWGSGDGEFGIEYDEMSDILPGLNAVLPDGLIVVSDSINLRQKIFDTSGKLVNTVDYIKEDAEGGFVVYKVPEYGMTKIKRILNDGSYLTGLSGKYHYFSPSNEYVRSVSTMPLELGTKSHRKLSNDYEIIVTYEDQGYKYNSHYIPSWTYRNQDGFLFAVHYDSKTNQNVISKYDRCSRLINSIKMPTDKIEILNEKIVEGDPVSSTVITDEEYGSPVIGPDGSVYCWQRTPDTYSILKWAWVDDPSDPKIDCKK